MYVLSTQMTAKKRRMRESKVNKLFVNVYKYVCVQLWYNLQRNIYQESGENFKLT
jgi:hypothetical protein